jgi:hypothetical protein
MENLFVDVDHSDRTLLVYDLKGSVTNRLIKEPSATLLDTNFKIDRNSEPIPLVKDDFKTIDRAIHNDCKFLSNHDVVDYSLLMIIDNKNRKIKVGIIDYLR